MVVLHHNQHQLIIGADTRKIALLMVGGFILLCLLLYSLITNIPALDQETMQPIAAITILFLSCFMAYYFYHVFGKSRYVFDKKTKKLNVHTTNILGVKTKSYPLRGIFKVETRQIATYAYGGALSAHAHDVSHSNSVSNYYKVVILHLLTGQEINLTPNAAYFFLHPFDALTIETDKGLGVMIAKFLGVRHVQSKRHAK